MDCVCVVSGSDLMKNSQKANKFLSNKKKRVSDFPSKKQQQNVFPFSFFIPFHFRLIQAFSLNNFVGWK